MKMGEKKKNNNYSTVKSHFKIQWFTSESTISLLINSLYLVLIFLSINLQKKTNIIVRPRIYYHENHNRIYRIPKFINGPLSQEENIDFEQRTVKITFFKDNNISSPLLYHNCTKKEVRNYIPCGALPSYREISTFYHLKNAFVSPGKQVGLETGGSWKLFTHVKSKSNVGKVVSGYVHVVFPPSTEYLVYGHWINDCLCSFLEMPKWVWSLNPVIVCGVRREIMKFHLKAMRLDHIELVNPYDDYVFCENLYLVKAGDDVHGFGIAAYPILQDKFRKRFGLNRIKPTKYHFMNRETEYRHFLNLNEIINETEKLYNIHFEQLFDKNDDRVLQARNMAATKLLVAPSGSHIYNAFFMHQGTAMVLLMANYAAFPEFRLTQNLGIWCIGIMHPHMEHYGGPGNGNVPITLKSIGYALYAIKNGKWPPYDKDFHPALNMQSLKAAYKKFGTKWVDIKDVYQSYP